MAEVTLEINGRKYRMACEDGQEPHLHALAERFNTRLDTFRGSFGEVGDNRLAVMAGLAVLDDLVEAERRLATLARELEQVTSAGQAMAREAEEIEARFTRRLDEATRRVELAAAAIESAGSAQSDQ